MKNVIRLEEFYVIELQEDIISPINDRDYHKGERLIAWEDKNSFRVANCNCDFIPKTAAKKVLKVNFTKIEG